MSKRKPKQDLFPSLQGQGMIAIDCETRDPDLKVLGGGSHRKDCYIAGVAVGTEAGFRGYFPVGHASGENLPKEKVFGWLRQELKTDVPKVGARLIYDLEFLGAAEIEVGGLHYDIQNAEPLLDENKFVYSLESLAQEYLDEGKRDAELDAFLVQHFGKKNPKNNIWRAPAHIVAPYAIADVDLPLRIFAKQEKRLKAEGLWQLFVMETKLIPMLVAMRRRGVRVNIAEAEKMLGKMRRRYKQVLVEVKRETGIEVAPWAAKSLAKVFDHLGLRYPLTEKTKAPSFQAAWLDQHDHPITAQILELRRLDKMCGTFLEGSILERNYQGRIHCNFNQQKSDDGGAVTGRFSSSMPNLQFIPVRTEEGRQMRRMFEADKGCQWYKIDYSQIEYRLMAHDAGTLDLPGSREVVDEFISNPDADFHAKVAEMTGLSRSSAKTINFGLAYGEGAAKLSRQLGLSKEDGEEMIKEYHRRAPFMKPLIQGSMAQAAQSGEVQTIMGRKRRFVMWATRVKKGREYHTIYTRHRISKHSQRAFCHKAMNARVQGSAADVMKKAMVDSWESGVFKDLGGCPQLTVHDELDGSFGKSKREVDAVGELAHIMEGTAKLMVPLKCDVSTGPNWGDAE